MLTKSNGDDYSSNTEGTYSIDYHDVVNVVEFCPFQWSSRLLAIGTSSRVSIIECRFQEENAEVDGIEYTSIKDFHHECRVSSIAWSPETSLVTVPKILRFATAGPDRKIRVFSSDLKEANDFTVIGEHRDYINDICFHPDKGDHIASVSDDNTCCIWGMDKTKIACFPLRSPGVAVSWHPEELGKIMIAEKRGVIRFYNVQTGEAIMSLECGQAPLASADWCRLNPLQVTALVGPDCFIFDTSRSSLPLECKSSHTLGGKCVKWSRSYDHLLATTGRPGAQIKVLNVKSNQVPLSHDLMMLNGISWHLHLPMIVAGGDKKLHFWMVETA